MRNTATNDIPGNVLCVSNFPIDAGYAWDFIGHLYEHLARDLAGHGVRTWVAYPELARPLPRPRHAEPVELRVSLSSPIQLFRLLRMVKRRDIRAVYLTDRPLWHPSYALLRAAGIRRIIVHVHSSGDRKPAAGFRAVLKRISRAARPAFVDVAVAVSEFVRQRTIRADSFPESRIRVIFNSAATPRVPNKHALRERWHISPERRIVLCIGRAAEYKGVHHLLRAFDILCSRMSPPPVLIYFGDGPYMRHLTDLRDELNAGPHIVLAGYEPNVARISGGADLAVVPSTWEEAFGLAALEPAAQGVPVIASCVGGLPEVVEDGVTGLLVPPGDPEALADAMECLLSDSSLRRAMGERGRLRARKVFSEERQLRELTNLFCEQLGIDG